MHLGAAARRGPPRTEGGRIISGAAQAGGLKRGPKLDSFERYMRSRPVTCGDGGKNGSRGLEVMTWKIERLLLYSSRYY